MRARFWMFLRVSFPKGEWFSPHWFSHAQYVVGDEGGAQLVTLGKNKRFCLIVSDAALLGSMQTKNTFPD